MQRRERFEEEKNIPPASQPASEPAIQWRINKCAYKLRIKTMNGFIELHSDSNNIHTCMAFVQQKQKQSHWLLCHACKHASFHTHSIIVLQHQHNYADEENAI